MTTLIYGSDNTMCNKTYQDCISIPQTVMGGQWKRIYHDLNCENVINVTAFTKGASCELVLLDWKPIAGDPNCIMVYSNCTLDLDIKIFCCRMKKQECNCGC